MRIKGTWFHRYFMHYVAMGFEINCTPSKHRR